MAHIVQGVWSTVSAFVIDTRSLRSMSDSVSAIRAMSAVSKELGIMVQDTCEAAYKQHEVWQMVIPFAVEAWLITSFNELGCHHLTWCCLCVKDKDVKYAFEEEDELGCSECDCVRAINVVSKQFEETVGDAYIAANNRETSICISLN